MRAPIVSIFAALILLTAVTALAYLTDTAIYSPPADYLSPQLPPQGVTYTDPVFNQSGPPDWLMRFSDAANTPRADGVAGNLKWASHEYATTSPFNADNTRVLLIHQAYYGLYSANGTLIRQLVPVCASCAPRWSRTDRDVFYYFRGRQVYSYNQNTNVSTALGPQLPYDQVFYKGEDDICFDGEHRIGFGRRGGSYYIYIFSVNTGTVVSEYLIGNSTDYANIDSAEIAPNDIVIVSFVANDRNDTKSFNKGVWAFTIDLHPLWQLHSAPGHHDLGRDVDGTPILVITNSGSFHPLPGCQNGIEKISIPNPATRQCLLSLHWTLAVHVSMPDSGWFAYVSTYAPSDPWYGSMSRKQELFPRLSYSGAPWTTDQNSAYSGGRAVWSDNDASRVTYFFYGTEVRWIGYKDPASGIADVTLDGQTQSVDLYSSAPEAQSPVYVRQNLPTGFHNLAIDVTNRKNAASSGFKVTIDAIEDNPPWTTYTNEILMVRLDGGEVRRLAQHRSRPYNTYNYTPRASVSRDGSLIMVASNYGLPVDGYTSYVDAYLMALSSATLGWNSSATTAAAARTQLMPEPFIPTICGDQEIGRCFTTISTRRMNAVRRMSRMGRDRTGRENGQGQNGQGQNGQGQNGQGQNEQ